jgi:RHS repeat-associated protein
MSNHLGSTACIFPLTGQNRMPIAQQITDAYGIPLTLQGAADPQRSRTSFIGRDVDKESNLGAFGAQLYSSEYGRFVAVDKMWEEYVGYTAYHYAFSNPVATLDWNGLGPGDAFKSIRAAALDFAKNFNGPSIVNNRELISRIYSFNDGTNVVYSYTTPEIGKTKSCIVGPEPEKVGTTTVSIIHTHGAASDAYATERPSNADVSLVGKGQKDYVVTPGGLLLEYDQKGKTTLVSNNVPSDPKSRTRANGIDPVITNEPSMQGVPGLDVPYDVPASA